MGARRRIKQNHARDARGTSSEPERKAGLHTSQAIAEKLSRPVSSLMQGKGWTKKIREQTLSSFSFMGIKTVGDLLRLSQDELFVKESRHKSKDSVPLVAIWKLIKEIERLGLSFREDHTSKKQDSHSTKNRDNEARVQKRHSGFFRESLDEKLARPVSFLFELQGWPDALARKTASLLESGGIRTIGDLVRLTYPEFSNMAFRDKKGNPVSLPPKLKNRIQKTVLRSFLCFGLGKGETPSFEEAGISKRTISKALEKGIREIPDLPSLSEILQNLGAGAFIELRALYVVFIRSKTNKNLECN